MIRTHDDRPTTIRITTSTILRNYDGQISNAVTCFTHLYMVNNPTTWHWAIVGKAVRFGSGLSAVSDPNAKPEHVYK